LVNKVLESVIRSSDISAERQAVEQLYGYLNTKPRVEQYYGREFDYRLGQWQKTCRWASYVLILWLIVNVTYWISLFVEEILPIIWNCQIAIRKTL